MVPPTADEDRCDPAASPPPPSLAFASIDLTSFSSTIDLSDDENEDNATDDGDEIDEVLQSLVDEFTARNGREPEESEVKQWVDTLRAAGEEAAVAKFGGGGEVEGGGSMSSPRVAAE